MGNETYKKYFDLDEIVKSIKDYIPDFDEKLFLKAFDFAQKAHDGQFRKDGTTPYIVHPVETVKILIYLHADENVLISALLHDVPEDTQHDLNEVESLFGDEVAFLVDGITKLSKVHYQHNMPERSIESLKKLFLHTAKDIRIIIIKLADRLHNMRTLKFVEKPEKRLRIATETLEIFVPIANLLGISKLKTELEDLCFQHIFPSEYDKLKLRIDESNNKNKVVLKNMTLKIRNALTKAGIKADVGLRDKGLYRAYKRICSLGKTIDSVKDRVPMKVIVDTPSQCYEALGIIHGIYLPRPDSFKDYIANPKVNGYQSLHTIVFGIDGVITEIQIQTKQMDFESEYGIAASFFGKANNKTGKVLHLSDDKRSLWLNKIIEIEKEKHVANDFLEDLKIDVLQDRIFVFTPKGETVDLPKDATVIDFAYAIHSEVGDHAIKADINGEIRPITSILKTGDVIKVITEPDVYPELYWLSFVKTNSARNRILLHLKKVTREEKIIEGKKLLQKEFDIAGLGLCENLNFKKFKEGLNKNLNKGLSTLQDLFMAIGEGEVKTSDVLKIIRLNKKFKLAVENKKERSYKINFRITAKNRFGLLQDITSIIYRAVDDVTYVKGWASKSNEYAYFDIQVIVNKLETVSQVFNELEQFDDIYGVYPVYYKGLFLFIFASIVTTIAWLINPFILEYYINQGVIVEYGVVSNIFLFIDMGILMFLLLSTSQILKRYFPSMRNKLLFWRTSSALAAFGLVLLFIELQEHNLHFEIAYMLILTSVTAHIIFNHYSLKKK